MGQQQQDVGEAAGEGQAQGTQAAGEQRPQQQQGQDQPRREEITVQRSGGAMARPPSASPFSLMSRIMDDMDRFFSSFGFGPSLGSVFRPFEAAFAPIETTARGGWVPAIEVSERDGCLVFCADLPGVSRDDLKVEVVGNELVIFGERKRQEEKERGGTMYSERSYGCFERRITLPQEADTESVEATFDDGVLEVSVRTTERGSRVRTIEVKSGQESERGAESIH